MAETPLDRAFRAQEAAPGDAGLRLRFHERVLDAELVLPVEEGEGLQPEVFALAEGRFVLAFDREERMADFLGAPARFAALSGRRLAALLAGHGTGIALNLGAASATLLPAGAVDWLAAMSGEGPRAASARAEGFAPPDVPAALLDALGTKLAAMAGVVERAHLVEARYAGGERRLLLALGGVPEEAERAVAAAVAEAVRFSGLGLALDVTFGAGVAGVEGVGMRFDLATPPAPAGPGMDPERPRRLR